MRNEWREGLSLTEYAERWVDMAPHLHTLTGLAGDAATIVEFGVRGGVSTWALLDGLPPGGSMLSVDPDPDVRVMLPPRVRDDPRWTLIEGNDLLVHLPSRADLVMIDTSHDYHHTLAELVRVEAMVPRMIALHDYFNEPTPGVRQAVDEFMAVRSTWLLAVEPSQWGLALLTPR